MTPSAKTVIVRNPRKTCRRNTLVGLALFVASLATFALPAAWSQSAVEPVDCDAFRTVGESLVTPGMGGLDTTPSDLSLAPVPEQCGYVRFLRDTATYDPVTPSTRTHVRDVSSFGAASLLPTRISMTLAYRHHLRASARRSTTLRSESTLREHDWYIYIRAGWEFSPAAAAQRSEPR